jgi:NADPH:quinone reductase-like Zn-dependent oxidoreductase
MTDYATDNLHNSLRAEAPAQGADSIQSAIIVTGAAGFIGSCMVQYLNERGFENLVLVDDFGIEAKKKELGNEKLCFNC